MGHDDARDGFRAFARGREARVDAGVKELNEMTIGRTDDPENPLRAMAFEAASLFGTGSRTPSGPAVMVPRQQAGHMIAIDTARQNLIFALASEGPSTQGTEVLSRVASTCAITYPDNTKKTMTATWL